MTANNGTSLLRTYNPVNMVRGWNSFTQGEFTRDTLGKLLFGFALLSLQVAVAAFSGYPTVEVWSFVITLNTDVGFLAIIAAGVAAIAGYLLSWANIPDPVDIPQVEVSVPETPQEAPEATNVVPEAPATPETPETQENASQGP